MANTSRFTEFYTSCLEADINDGLLRYFGGLSHIKREAPCGRGNRHIDLLVTLDNGGTVAIEIKKGKYDFKTKCGLNFVGTHNYLAVPSPVVGYAIRYLRSEGMDGVGVIEIDECGRSYIVL